MDSQRFRDLILDIPSQIPAGISAAGNIKIKRKPSQIVICGMGGSALAGEFLKAIFDEYKIKIPLILHKDYGLPLTVGKNSFIICTSYSGNTEETISAYKKANSLKLETLAMSTGGLLAELAKKRKDRYIEIDVKDLPPRLSTLYMLSAIIAVFANSGVLPRSIISKFKKAAGYNFEELEKSAQEIALEIGSKSPLVYSSNRLSAMAYFLKISFNENAKIHAFSNYLSECQHNEIEGFDDPSLAKKFHAIFIEDGKDNDRIIRRIEIMKHILSKKDFDFSSVDLNDRKTIFEKIIFILIFGGLLSLAVAQSKNQDPVSTPLIEGLKRSLS